MYPTTPGYNEFDGWGRVDAARALGWVAARRVPPEAEIDSPTPFATLSPDQRLQVNGAVGAVRATSFRYQVDVAPGVAPRPGQWRLAALGDGSGSFSGVLASIPLSEVAALFPGGAEALTGGPVGPSGAPDPDRFTFSVRVLVEDAGGLAGVAQQADFLHADAQLLAGFPRRLPSSIVAPPRLAPIGPGSENVLLVAQAGGTVNAFLPDGSELPGWPVHTAVMTAVHPGEAAYASPLVGGPPRGEIVGGLAVGPLDDGGAPGADVVAADMQGNVYAWDSAGRLLPGWPEHTNPLFSGPAARNAQNRLLPGFAAAPALGSLQGGGTLDVIVPSLDRHVYAWTGAGRPVPGWPVLVVDPAEVQSVDPVTHQVTFLSSADALIGTELVDTPAVGSLEGNGRQDVVLGSDEEYGGAPNADLGALGAALSGAHVNTGNSRVYAIHPDGSLHPPAPGAPDPPGLPDPGAFLPGWPVKVAQIDPGILPTIANGVTGSPALADLKGDGRLEVVTSASAGPVYELDPDGTSFLGDGSGGLPVVSASVNGNSLLDWTLPALGSPTVAPLGPEGSPPSVLDPAASLGKLLDESAPGKQTPHANQVGAWSSASGQFDTGFPARMNDLQFFDEPIVADVEGSGAGSFAVEASGLYDLRAYGPGGTVPADFPKFTGGWVTFGPAYGPWGTLPTQVLVAGTRSGQLLVWSTPTPACAASGPWPQVHHDLDNTSNLQQPLSAPSCAARTS
jgi:hypothetical protein